MRKHIELTGDQPEAIREMPLYKVRQIEDEGCVLGIRHIQEFETQIREFYYNKNKR